MKTKIVYALVSSPSDFYLEQALLSVHSLRMYNPDAEVELVVDEFTDVNLVEKRAKIKNYLNAVHVVETPEGYTSVQRSRFLKTNLREFIKGDFLFLDCDTIICESLSDIDKVDADIAMVADGNADLLLSASPIIERCNKIQNIAVKGSPYFNSGVIYAKDTSRVHQFYNEWNTTWRKSNEIGIKYDQPALCITNVNNDKIVQELNGVWNCQFKLQGFPYLKKAKIIHYYSNNGENDTSYTLPMNQVYQQVKDEGITPLIENLIYQAKTDLYAVMTVNKEQSMIFFYSHLLYLYTNRPLLYKILKNIGKVLEKIMY